MKLLYELDYRMRTNDYDTYDRLTPTSILDTFQDVAGNHAHTIGMGFDDMVARGYYWVIFREKITILKSPKTGASLKAITWPEAKRGLSFIRNYKLVDNSNNETLAVGSSVWVVINTQTRKLERARDLNYEGELHDEVVYDDFDKLKEIDFEGKEYLHEVKFSDLDHNGHMNNSKYADIFLDAINLEKNEVIKELQIDFVHEAKLGDIIKVKYQKVEDTYYFICYINDVITIRAEMKVDINE